MQIRLIVILYSWRAFILFQLSCTRCGRVCFGAPLYSCWLLVLIAWLDAKSVSGYANPSADIHGNQMTAQFFFIGHSVTSSTVGISTGQWTALWCSNMKKIVWLLHVLDINVGGGMRFDSWCWSAHFHLGINGNTTRISSIKCKSIYLRVDRLFLFRFYYRKQCRNIGRFFLTIFLFPLLLSAKT